MTTVGFSRLMPFGGGLFLLLAIGACSEPTTKEYFCETYLQQGQSQFYKQQIVQLNNQSICLLDNVDTPVCGKFNQVILTPWRSLDSKRQVRETIEAKSSKDMVSIDINQETKSIETGQPPQDSKQMSTHYEFQKKSASLTMTTDEIAEPTVFSCKPWAKRAWWQVY